MDYTTNFAPAAGAAVFPLSPRGTSGERVGERGFYCSASYGFLRMRAQARTWLRQPFKSWPCGTNPHGQALPLCYRKWPQMASSHRVIQPYKIGAGTARPRQPVSGFHHAGTSRPRPFSATLLPLLPG